ncbi:unnamed protein product [Rotaria sordida]|uniref:NHL repeat-containing protein n=1 Tax=Rotaria sordida TaxID=392033 RepID=A0A815JBY7_9BILA|nr:unnamed protein product [Rotaria sordida]
MKWLEGAREGIIVAGGQGKGNGLQQLSNPNGIVVDQIGTIYVCDEGNNRIVRWVKGAKEGTTIIGEGAREGIIVAGGQGKGNGLHQLSNPKGIVVDQIGTVYICDSGNNRVMTWVKGAKEGSIIIGGEEAALDRPVEDTREGIIVAGGQGNGNGLHQLSQPNGIVVDELGSIYVCDTNNNRIMRWLQGAKEGSTIIGEGAREGSIAAGGQGKGSDIRQLSNPNGIVVDELGTVYVCDSGNNRIMRWLQGAKEGKGAREGIVVAGGQGKGNGLHQLSEPNGIVVDKKGTVYVCDSENNRVMRWFRGSKEGSVLIGEGAREGIVVAGGQGKGNGLHQLSNPSGIVIDELGTVYVCDPDNNRIMRWIKGSKVGIIIIGDL